EPKTVQRRIGDLITPYSKKTAQHTLEQVAEVADDVRYWAQREDTSGLAAAITEMEHKMLEHAKNLEFEKAAQLRDQVSQLRILLLK
ncbi:MAG: UvrB/UvrC motif-containing protein, partial [Shewanellaceae bacterium]|nr:UvrB/UvrC motif-containing protein [Shewanellaceae bacterium]